MGKDSSIEWTDHTFNPWWGCVKVSPGCQHCYAETWANRYGHNVWGPAKTTERRTFGDKHWAEPLKWNAAAERAGERKRVFCSSMADVFEDHPALEGERLRLFNLIFQTGNLDWLLLTKRPENVMPMLKAMHIRHGITVWDVWQQGYFGHVWLGTSVEDQAAADARIAHLLQVPAKVRFLSCEPLLGGLDLTRYLGGGYVNIPRGGGVPTPANVPNKDLHWVIAGGESGPNARPMHPAWVRSLRDQCAAAGVPFFFKQWGEYWPAGKSIVENKSCVFFGDEALYRVGKARAGRLLDGVEHNAFPEVQR